MTRGVAGSAERSFAGGCLCGAVRYAAAAAPLSAGYCHCRMCQKLSGAAALPWASFADSDFRYTLGKPAIYQSSAHGQREFCAACGSQLVFRSTRLGGTVEINVGTLDEPAAVTPQSHIWWESRIPWFDTRDDLPRHAQGGPAGDGG